MTHKEPATEESKGVDQNRMVAYCPKDNCGHEVCIGSLDPDIQYLILKGQAWDELERWLKSLTETEKLSEPTPERSATVGTLMRLKYKMSSLIGEKKIEKEGK